jgi:hypothetical protein
MDFTELLGELSDLFGHYVFVSVIPALEFAVPAAAMVGRLNRGDSGQTFFDSPLLDDDDLTFYVGSDEPGAKSCFFLSPTTFTRAWWDDSRDWLVVEIGRHQVVIRVLDDLEDSIEASLTEERQAALRSVMQSIAADLKAKYPSAED